LRHKKIGAHGADITISPSDIYDMTQLSQRTDRVLPNRVCLLPPLKTCGSKPRGGCCALRMNPHGAVVHRFRRAVAEAFSTAFTIACPPADA
jgi:hypothetical protein